MWLRVLGWTFTTVIAATGIVVVLVVGLSMADEDTTRQATLFGFLLLVFAGTTSLLLRAKVVADERGVQLVNYLSKKQFLWNEIDRFEVGFAYWGISLVPRSGTPVRVNAIQKPNLATTLGVQASFGAQIVADRTPVAMSTTQSAATPSRYHVNTAKL
jgi:hypothetical protein